MKGSRLSIRFDQDVFQLELGQDCFGPPTEVRMLDAVRESLRDQDVDGPEKLYAIMMDVGHREDRRTLTDAMLLFGVVGYASGTLGKEPIRSQGHVHAISPHSGWSPPELFEIWLGSAIIYMQQYAADDPGRCFAITAREGDHVLVPPGWAHMVLNASTREPMVFGALCDRGYKGFEYEAIRARKGLAFFPILEDEHSIRWEHNPGYQRVKLIEKIPNLPPTLELNPEVPLYDQAVANPEAFSFIPYPQLAKDIWMDFTP